MGKRSVELMGLLGELSSLFFCKSVCLSHINFDLNCFFSVIFTSDFDNTYVNDIKESGYEVPEQILNICINYET